MSVQRATGISRSTIYQGIRDLENPQKLHDGLNRTRKPGGGRKKTVDVNPEVRNALEALVEPITRGDPESPLRWTCKSLCILAGELKGQGYSVSHRMVGDLLHETGYSLQANRKTSEGKQHPDCNLQFEFINLLVAENLEKGNPVISVDAKKKELVGNFKNVGQEWRPVGPVEDFHLQVSAHCRAHQKKSPRNRGPFSRSSCLLLTVFFRLPGSDKVD